MKGNVTDEATELVPVSLLKCSVSELGRDLRDRTRPTPVIVSYKVIALGLFSQSDAKWVSIYIYVCY